MPRSTKRTLRPASPRAFQVSVRVRPFPRTLALIFSFGSAVAELTVSIAGDPGWGSSPQSPAAGFSTRSSTASAAGRKTLVNAPSRTGLAASLVGT